MFSFIKNLIVAFISILAPIHTVLLVVGFLIFTDLITGILAAYRRGEKITSAGMRRTVSKMLIYQLVIVSGFLCETYLTGGLLPISKLSASVIGLVEMKSILENAESFFGEPIFKKLIRTLGSDNDKN